MMRRATAVVGAAAIVLGSVGAFAQGNPSFSGSWTPDMEKTVAAKILTSRKPSPPRARWPSSKTWRLSR